MRRMMLTAMLASAAVALPLAAQTSTRPATATAPTTAPAASAPAPARPALNMEQRGQAIFDALDAKPPNTAALAELLTDVGHVEIDYRSEPLKKWEPGLRVIEGRIYRAQALSLNRPAGGPAPREWVEQIAAPVGQGLKPTLLKLAVAPALAIVAQRDRILAQADRRIRQGLLKLAEEYPVLKTTNWGTLEEAVDGSSPPAHLEIWAGHFSGGNDGLKQPVPPDAAYNVLVTVRPLAWPEPPGQWQQKQLYANLALMGQVHASAADPKLNAAIKFLVQDALADLGRLDLGQPVSPAQVPATAQP